MKKIVLIAALLTAIAAQPVWAAKRHAASHCPAASALEAEQGLRYLNSLMIVSSMCRDTVYNEFELRNRLQIIHYQKEMIAHLHGKPAFDRWITSLANQAAQQQGGNQLICQQQAALLQQAKAMDTQGFRSYAVAHATTAVPADCKH